MTGRILPRIRITVFCEGKNSEPEYIKTVTDIYGNQLVEVVLERAAGVPITLVEKAVSELKRRGRPKNSFEQNDQIWVAFDRDDHPKVPQAINAAKQSGVRVAYSNPCFELWGILHFSDHDAPISRHAAQKLLSKLMPGYDPNKGKHLNLDSASASLNEASARAKKMRQRRISESKPLENPYTDFDVLVDLIIANGRKLKRR